MKILKHFLLGLTLTHTSLFPWPPEEPSTPNIGSTIDAEIVPFDREKHHEQISALLTKTFVSEPTISKKDKISVLVKKNKATRRTPAETVLGFIAYHNKYSSQLTNDKITVIEHLIIEKQHRGKGYGKHLFKHVENYAHNSNSKKIIGTSASDTTGFYDKFGGRITNDQNDMSKDLPESTDALVEKN